MNEKKILWKCRRGMLELDLLFLKFYEQKYSFLSTEDKEAFVQFLEESDPQLAAWLLGNEVSYPDQYKNIIEKMRE